MGRHGEQMLSLPTHRRRCQHCPVPLPPPNCAGARSSGRACVGGSSQDRRRRCSGSKLPPLLRKARRKATTTAHTQAHACNSQRCRADRRTHYHNAKSNPASKLMLQMFSCFFRRPVRRAGSRYNVSGSMVLQRWPSRGLGGPAPPFRPFKSLKV